MQVVQSVIVVLVLASLIGTVWNFSNIGTCEVKNSTGGCGTGATWSNTTPYDSSIVTIMKLLPLFLVIGGLLYAVSAVKSGQIKI